MNQRIQEQLRHLPSVSALLDHDEVHHWLEGLPRSVVVASLQAAVEAARRRLLNGGSVEAPTEDEILAAAESELALRAAPGLRPVINATGIVLHTGLGRAALCDTAIEAIVEGASGYCNLEFDLESGRRGKRTVHVVELLKTLTGAESACVVNNNAAATLLILQTFAAGREVIVSRGQLVEIGGSFRLPDIMSAGSAVLREVGTTNRTRLADYERAIGAQTALLLSVHPSNYRIVGFTESVPMAELAALAHRHGLVAVDDLGSGALIDFAALGLPTEPHVRDSLSAGADLACFSGDKLLGGPQCGVIVGRRDLIERLNASPLMRTYRVDKLTLLALEATLRAYLDPEEAIRSVPTLAMLRASTDDLAERARDLSERLHQALPEEKFLVCSDVGYVGGGSMPQAELPTVVVQWRPSGVSTDQMVRALRQAETPVVARIRDDAVCLDLRTIRNADLATLVESVAASALDAGECSDNPEADHGPNGLRLPVL